MDFGSFVEGPLLIIAFLIFLIGILVRLAFFVSSITRERQGIKENGGSLFKIFARFLVPFHRAVPKRPLYSSFRYIFHICMFVVPIWLAGHISLWEESWFGWSWSPLPDGWANWMTLIFLALSLFFIIRHIVIKEVRLNSSLSDYLIIIITALPFITGYFLAHGTLDSIQFMSDNMWSIHILTGELMLVAVVFLFCRTRMSKQKCTGCESCVLSCPTRTLESHDSGKQRVFNYSHYQCICCGSCVNACPEDAAELRHEMGLKTLYQVFSKQEIRSVELESCNRCGALFVPEPLMNKIHMRFSDDYLDFCPECRKANVGESLRRFSPRYGLSKSTKNSPLVHYNEPM